MPDKSIKLIAPPNTQLAEMISRNLASPLVPVEILEDSNREITFSITQTIRGHDVYLIVPMSGTDTNDKIFQTLIMIASARAASADNITVVIPYFPYVRHDKRDRPRAPITARLMADMLTSCGCDHILTLELHASQTQGFFSIPVDNLALEPCVIKYLREYYGSEAPDVAVVAPSAVGAKRASAIADHLHFGVALIHRDREGRPDEKSDDRMTLVGNVQGCRCIIITDIVDTCETVSKDAELLFKGGASSVVTMAAHGLLTDVTIKNLMNSKLEKLIITNSTSVNHRYMKCHKLAFIDISGVLAESIRRLHNGESMSNQFDEYYGQLEY